jgi:AraC-like DNA-binding protein
MPFPNGVSKIPIFQSRRQASGSPLAAAMRQSESPEESTQSRVAHPRKLDEIREFILEHISDPNLSAERIAVAFSMSRRSRYNLFDKMGQTRMRILSACALM